MPDKLSVIQLIRSDWRVNRANRKSRLILAAFRLLHPWSVASSGIRRLFAKPFLALYVVVVEWMLGVELPLKTEVGPGLRIAHGFGLVVNDRVRIGSGCTLRQCTTIGVREMRDGSMSAAPVLEDEVDVGSNVVILGAVRIGRGARIGAGAVVVRDVPAGAVAVGNPAQIVSRSLSTHAGDKEAVM